MRGCSTASCGSMPNRTMLSRACRLDPQDAVEHPRIATYSFPDSFEPHDYFPGRLCVESRIARETGDALAARGHRVAWWPERIWRAGAVCTIHADLQTG